MHTRSLNERALHELEPTTDGRTARRHRNKASVLDAVVELFVEDTLSPGVNEVAERSGVSLRSVYRYFDDVEALIASAIQREYERAKPLLADPDPGDRPLDARIQQFCAARIALFQQLRAVHAAATLRSRLDPTVESTLDRTRRKLTRQTEAMFVPELMPMAPAEAEVARLTLDVLTQFETLELLQRTRGLSSEQTERYLAETLTDILR